ncbi:MAG: ABC transporter substrate-binding protein [Candidatus Polarisedimenticolia bacterium]
MRVLAALVAAVAFVVSQPASSQGPDPARTVRDGVGRQVTLPALPSRIVSLAPSVTEILFAVGAGDRVVGVTDFCDNPPEARSLPRVGGLIHPDLERLASLKPQLAIASTAGNYREDAERIEKLGIPVYTLAASSLEEILQSVEKVGDIVGSQATALKVSASLRERVARVRQEAATRRRPRVLFVIEPEPLIAPGPETFVGEALRIAGADLVSQGASSGWNQIDLEQVVALNPDLILATPAHAAWARALPDSPTWRLVPAAREGKVRVISDAIQHPGPRLIDGMEEVARLLESWRAGS